MDSKLAAFIGVVGTIILAILERRYKLLDRFHTAAEANTAAKYAAGSQTEGRLFDRIGTLEERIEEMQNSSLEREGRIAELERKDALCQAEIAALKAGQVDIKKLQSYFEQQLLESELLRAGFDAASLGIVMADKAGNIVKANRTFLEISGYHDFELLGQPLVMLMPERYRAGHQAAFTRGVETGVFRLLGRLIRVSLRTKSNEELLVDLFLDSWKVGADIYFSGRFCLVDAAATATEVLDLASRI